MQPDIFHQAIRNHRESLRRCPETGFDLPKTHRYVTKELKRMGYEPRTIAESGVVAVARGRKSEAVAFRADMDALPSPKTKESVFFLKDEANMHVCGHDGHMAILLGLAEFLAGQRLEKSVVFIFQPAEETNGGAKEIVATGLFEAERVQAVFGLHLYPGLPEGRIGLVDGVMTAQDGEFDIVVEGVSAHGASPHEGSDALLAAVNLVNALNSLQKSTLDPRAAAALNIGRLESGNGRNIVPSRAEISGAIRTFDKKLSDRLVAAVEKAIQGIEAIHDVHIRADFRTLHPPVENDADLFAIMKTILREEEYTEMGPLLLAEDFSHYQGTVPGFFFLLGTQNHQQGFTHPLHSVRLDYNDTVLLKGVETYLRILRIMDVWQE